MEKACVRMNEQNMKQRILMKYTAVIMNEGGQKEV